MRVYCILFAKQLGVKIESIVSQWRATIIYGHSRNFNRALVILSGIIGVGLENWCSTYSWDRSSNELAQDQVIEFNNCMRHTCDTDVRHPSKINPKLSVCKLWLKLLRIPSVD